ncbi:MAG: hypothetical protein ABI742_09225 [Gemmatimonadota bacterium]
MRGILVALAAVSLVRPPLPAQQPVTSSRHLGTVRFAISCNAAVRPRFNQAVALLHSFAFPEAVASFNAVLREDPHCAIAAWGLALSAWGNPFAPGSRSAEQLRSGQAAVDRARNTGKPTARERGYIDAVVQLYEHADSLSQRARLIGYRDAMAALTAQAPSDTEAAIFHALAQSVAADPADKSYTSQLAAGATLERLFAVMPDHPGLAHYIIHTYDVPALAHRALAAAERYSQIAPGMSHALHMPSHVYTRVGAWQESIDANVAAAAAAHREGAVAEELHSGDYQVYAYLQTGQDRAARRVVASLPAVARRLDPTRITTGAPPAAGYFAIAAIPARYALERGDWADAARLERLPSPVPYADAVTCFARAVGAARSGDTLGAKAAILELGRIRDSLADQHEAYWRDQVEIQVLDATAWEALAAGRNAEALATMRAAADREDATEKSVVSPGPLAPARELLGEMLLSLRNPAEALAAFETALVHEPNRFRSVAGAAESARAAGDSASAGRYYDQLLRLGAGADRPGRPALADAARFTGHQP